jgi:CubicO group peptidase (beta-lactamase class C family)
MWAATSTIVFLLCTSVVAQPSGNGRLPPDSEIRQILVQRVDTLQQSVGIVVGIIGPRGHRVVAYGTLDKGENRPVDGNSLFEIGSITKVFTSLLLADMVQRGEVGLRDPVSKYLPASVKVPEKDGRSITLLDLATNMSGLPRLPNNFHPNDPGNPYADYSVEQLYDFLSHYQLIHDIGSHYEYSNLGFGLLGHVLARRAGESYEQLIEHRICKPLGMNSTVITLSRQQEMRFATGHNVALQRTEAWDLPTLAGAGALRSTANDLITFLAANLRYVNSPLTPAVESMLKVRRPIGTPGADSALGWQIHEREGHELVWHGGATAGFRSFIGFDPQKRIGVVVLSNAETPVGVGDIGQHLLDPSVPLYQPPKQRSQVSLDPKQFDNYVGRYELGPNFIITISRNDDHFFEQATGQPKAEIFPESRTEFFLKIVDAEIAFQTGSSGHATGLILHQGQKTREAKRIGELQLGSSPKANTLIIFPPFVTISF